MTAESTSFPRRAAALALVAAAAFAFALLFHDRGLVMGEEGQILTEAEAILAGKVLYRDIDCFVTPGVWYTTAAFLKATGPSLDGTRVVMAVLFALTAVVLYSIAAGVASRRAALGAVVALGIYRTLIFPLGSFVFYTDFALFFVLCGAYALLRASGAATARWLATAGAAFGLAFLYKQNIGAAGLGAAFVLTALYHRRARSLVAFSSPPILLTGATLTYFAAEGALPALVHGLIVVPLTGFAARYSISYWVGLTPWTGVERAMYYLPAPFLAAFGFQPAAMAGVVSLSIARAVSVLVYALPIFLVAVVVVRALGRRRLPRVEGVLLALGLTTLVGAFPRSDFPHAAQGMVGFLPLVAYLVSTSDSRLRAGPLVAALLGVLLVFSIVLIARAPETSLFDHPRARVYMQPALRDVVSNTLARIERTVPAGERLAVIPTGAMYYFLSGRLPPTRDTIMLAHTLGADGGASAAERLEAADVRWVLLSELKMPWVEPLRSYAPVLYAYLHEHFEPVPLPVGPTRVGPALLHRAAARP